MMLPRNDFRSIWELAHLWEEADPDKTDPANLPEPVVDKLQKLIWETMRKQFRLRRPGGDWLVQQEG